MTTHTDNDLLKSLFREMREEEPSSGFEMQVMERMRMEAVRQDAGKKLRNQVLFGMSIGGGLVAILTLPVLFFIYFGYEIDFSELFGGLRSITYSIPSIEINPLMLSIGGTVLVILLIDLFIQKSKINE